MVAAAMCLQPLQHVLYSTGAHGGDTCCSMTVEVPARDEAYDLADVGR